MQDAVTAGREAGVRAIARHRVPAERLARMASEGAMAYVLRHAHRLAPGHALDLFHAYQAAYLDAARETAAPPGPFMDGSDRRSPAPPVAAGAAVDQPAPVPLDAGVGARDDRPEAREYGDRAKRRGPARRDPHCRA